MQHICTSPHFLKKTEVQHNSIAVKFCCPQCSMFHWCWFLHFLIFTLLFLPIWFLPQSSGSLGSICLFPTNLVLFNHQSDISQSISTSYKPYTTILDLEKSVTLCLFSQELYSLLPSRMGKLLSIVLDIDGLEAVDDLTPKKKTIRTVAITPCCKEGRGRGHSK